MIQSAAPASSTHVAPSGNTLSRPPVVQVQMLETAERSLWRRAWVGWKRIAAKIGNFQARVLLAIFYVLFLAPFALLLCWLSDPLAMKPGSRRGWLPRSRQPTSAAELAKRQF